MAAKLAGAGRGARFGLGQNSEMNVTPFVDVMLVLLIIFMVAAPLATTAIKLDMPRSQPGTPYRTPPSIVSLAGDGQIYISIAGGALQRSSLTALGNDLRASSTGRLIVIRADRHIGYGRFMAVMDRLHSDGYNSVGLVSERAAPGV